MILVLLFLQSLYVCSIAQDSNAIFLKLDDESIEAVNNDIVKKGSIEYNQIDLKKAPSKRNYDKLLYQDVNRPLPQKRSISKSLEKDIVRMYEDVDRLYTRLDKVDSNIATLQKSFDDVKTSSKKIGKKIISIHDGYVPQDDEE